MLLFRWQGADMYKKKYVLVVSMLVCVSQAHAVDDGADGAVHGQDWEQLMSLSMEDLTQASVTSASKRMQSLEEAPSPIYVLTAEDIQRTGARNLMELVKFIPGFYVYPRIDQMFVIATRGLRSSSNDKVLFLVDGIPINNISQSGAVNEHIFPSLDKVKRVEVISGPGSTLWGSDASLGIISIITKDGRDIDGAEFNINYASEDNHREFNYLSGDVFSEGSYMFSFTYAENDGFGEEKNGYRNYVYDFETVPWNDQLANFNHIYPSYELFGKIELNNVTIKALASEKNVYSFWTTPLSTDWHDKQDKASIVSSKNMYFEIGHRTVVDSDKTLDTKFSAKQIEYVRDELVEVGSNHGSRFDDPNKQPIDYTASFPENGLGIEWQLDWDLNARHDLLLGARVRVVNAGRAENDFVNLETGKTPGDDTVRDSTYYLKTRDTTYGLYAEDTYHATNNLTLIGGVRVDYNSPRERVSVVSPRGAAIYKLSDELTAKYLYNTGYVRPLMSKSYEVAFTKRGSVKESEKIQAHDFILMYDTPTTQFSADLYQMTIDDQSSYNALRDRFENDGDLVSRGLDLLYRAKLTKKLTFDMNYGFATAKNTDEAGVTTRYYEGIPNHVYAMGLNYQFTPVVSLYGNVNGWRDLKMDSVEATDWVDSPPHPDYSGDYLLDLNLRFTGLMNDSLDLSLYMLNALDEDARLQAKDDWHAWWSYARDRSIGAKLSLKF